MNPDPCIGQVTCVHNLVCDYMWFYICSFRADCLKLLERCTNSSDELNKTCDIIAPRDSVPHCISLKQFLEPSPFGNDIISPALTSINNPCEPNPCANGFFCDIDRLCDIGDNHCNTYRCQPGCVVGASPGITLPRGSAVRVSLSSNSNSRCFGYFNCSVSFDTSSLCKELSLTDTVEFLILSCTTYF